MKMIGWVVLSEVVGIVGGLFTAKSVQTWYTTLNKPWFTPPNWLFGPMWVILYALMGIAVSLVAKNKRVRTIFLVHLFFNGIWSILFFGMKNIGLALVDIIIVWAMIVWLMTIYWKINKTATYLMIPYLMWVSLATALNFEVWRLN